jgi:shikimate 5-dehydrogenase
MHPRAAISPLAARELHCRVVMDLIYRPLRTELLQIAARKSIAGISGVEMFMAQGVAQWELWTGKRAPEARMRAAVLSALKEEARVRTRGAATYEATHSATKKSRGRT